MKPNNFDKNEKIFFLIMCKLIFTLILSVFFSCTNNLDKWYKIDSKKATLTYNTSEYIDFDYVNQNDFDLPKIDSLSGETKFMKSDNKINLGLKMRILLKGKYDMYQIKFGFKFFDKDGFLISEFVENSYDLCPTNKINFYQDKIETKLSDEELQKITTVEAKLIINDVKSSKDRYEKIESTK